MIIGTKLIYYEDSLNSCSGIGSSTVIGFCKELPKDVLMRLIKTHNIHSYMTLHCSPLSTYEYRLSGLCIYPLYASTDKQCEVKGVLDNFLEHPLMLSNQSTIFRISSLKDKLDTLDSTVNSLLSNNPWRKVYYDIYLDLLDIYQEILQGEDCGV